MPGIYFESPDAQGSLYSYFGADTVISISPEYIEASSSKEDSSYRLQLTGRSLDTSNAVIDEIRTFFGGQNIITVTEAGWSYSDVAYYSSRSSSEIGEWVTAGNDYITASGYSDNLFGGRGEDVISAAGGNDTVFGNTGADKIYGGFGDDTIYGGQDRDEIYGNQGNDVLFGNFADDTIYGGQGSDRIYGGQDRDYLFGNFQDDLIYGNLGDDVLYGGQNNDQLFGGAGNDWLDGNRDNDTLTGGAGADSFVLSAGQDVIKDFNLGEGDRIVLRYGDNPSISDSSSGLNIGVGDRNARLEGWTLASFNSESAFIYN